MASVIDGLGSLNPLWWVMLIIGLCTFVGHQLTKRVADDDARSDLSDSANKLLGATATGLFVLIGFTISILWSVLADELGHIDAEVESAASIAAYAYVLEDDAKSRVDDDLVNYLETAHAADDAALKQGDVDNLPSTEALVKLLEQVNSPENYTSENSWIKTQLVEAVAAVAAERASIRSIALREMPVPLKVVLFVAAGVVAVFAGASMAAHRKPYLVIGWVLSASLALTIALWLDNPFDGPVDADFGGLERLAEHIQQPIEVPPPQ